MIEKVSQLQITSILTSIRNFSVEWLAKHVDLRPLFIDPGTRKINQSSSGRDKLTWVEISSRLYSKKHNKYKANTYYLASLMDLHSQVFNFWV